MPSNMTIEFEDGISAWFAGPEWDEVAFEVFKDYESTIETAARANAIWEDQTGAARAGLRAEARNDGGIITMTLQHGVDYGFWLEVIQNGRFGIIQRTLEEHAQSIMNDAARAIAEARSGDRL